MAGLADTVAVNLAVGPTISLAFEQQPLCLADKKNGTGGEKGG
jgi:hypothetical protein